MYSEARVPGKVGNMLLKSMVPLYRHWIGMFRVLYLESVVEPLAKESAACREALTLRSSSGRSPPSLIPRFMEINLSTAGLSRTLGLCRLVFSMMMAKEST